MRLSVFVIVVVVVVVVVVVSSVCGWWVGARACARRPRETVACLRRRASVLLPSTHAHRPLASRERILISRVGGWVPSTSCGRFHVVRHSLPAAA